MKTVFETTASEVAEQILKTADEVSKTLPARYRVLAQRKISAAKATGTLQAAYKAGKDIELMAQMVQQ